MLLFKNKRKVLSVQNDLNFLEKIHPSTLIKSLCQITIWIYLKWYLPSYLTLFTNFAKLLKKKNMYLTTNLSIYFYKKSILVDHKPISSICPWCVIEIKILMKTLKKVSKINQFYSVVKALDTQITKYAPKIYTLVIHVSLPWQQYIIWFCKQKKKRTK